jgi:hypothetical protein
LRLRDVAQPGSVLAWGARGRWFESSHPDQQKADDSPLFLDPKPNQKRQLLSEAEGLKKGNHFVISLFVEQHPPTLDHAVIQQAAGNPINSSLFWIAQ